MAVTNSQEESNTHSQEHRASKNISHSLISNDLRLSVLHGSQTSDQITPVGTTVLSGNQELSEEFNISHTQIQVN